MESYLRQLQGSCWGDRAEITFYLLSTNKWVRKVKIMGIEDDLVHFTTESKGNMVYSVTGVWNISDVAVIWRNERDMLECMVQSEMVEEDLGDEMDYWEDDDGEDKIVLE